MSEYNNHEDEAGLPSHQRDTEPDLTAVDPDQTPPQATGPFRIYRQDPETPAPTPTLTFWEQIQEKRRQAGQWLGRVIKQIISDDPWRSPNG